jgi:protein SCO1/2
MTFTPKSATSRRSGRNWRRWSQPGVVSGELSPRVWQVMRIDAVFGRSMNKIRMLMITCLIGAPACNFSPTTVASHRLNQSRDRLAPIAMTDQHGRKVVLSSLKGKFALVDFIYTSCPGPCLLTTLRMVAVAKSLDAVVGSQLTLVSFTVDPENDGPVQLLEYSREQDADRPGWLFLTGTSSKVEQVMKDFHLPRQRQPDGVIDHITYCFLVGPDGREAAVYDPQRASAEAIARAIRDVIVRASSAKAQGDVAQIATGGG